MNHLTLLDWLAMFIAIVAFVAFVAIMAFGAIMDRIAMRNHRRKHATHLAPRDGGRSE